MGAFHLYISGFDLSSHLPNSLPVFSALFLAISPPNFCSLNNIFIFSRTTRVQHQPWFSFERASYRITTTWQLSSNYCSFRLWALWDRDFLSEEPAQKYFSLKVRVRQHISLLGPILSSLTALWKCHFATPFQNVFPGSLAISLGNYLVSSAAASAWTERQMIS